MQVLNLKIIMLIKDLYTHELVELFVKFRKKPGIFLFQKADNERYYTINKTKMKQIKNFEFILLKANSMNLRV